MFTAMRDKRWIAALFIGLLAFAACGDDGSEGGDGAGNDSATQGDCDTEPQTTEEGLVIEDLECGDGTEAEVNQLITVHYTGTLEDGTKFDSSKDRGEPFQFVLGAGMVIRGWDEGFQGMKTGGVRKLTVPPELAYGEAGRDGIPPNATLIFEVELLEVEELPSQ